MVYKSPAGAIAATATGLKKQTIGEDTVDVRRAVPKDQHQSGHVSLSYEWCCRLIVCLARAMTEDHSVHMAGV